VRPRALSNREKKEKWGPRISRINADNEKKCDVFVLIRIAISQDLRTPRKFPDDDPSRQG
jgi:hypothetical protein